MAAKITGPEHYIASTEWLAQARDADDAEQARAHREMAMIHAQLATAAAIAMNGAGYADSNGAGIVMPYDDARAWRRAASASDDD